MEKLYTCEEVAERYHVKSFTVRMWLREGKLHGIRPGKNYLIAESALQRFEQQARPSEEQISA